MGQNSHSEHVCNVPCAKNAIRVLFSSLRRTLGNLGNPKWWEGLATKRAQRASEASARSDSARAVVKSPRPGESYAALLGGVFCGLLNF